MTLKQFVENRRVLIVDDNRSIHEDFKKVLAPIKNSEEHDDFEARLLGKTRQNKPLPSFELHFASQGQDAVLMVKKSLENHAPFALAFVDIRMPPGYDGIETIEHIWSLDPHVQIAICTAYSDHSCEDIIEKFGHTDKLLFIRKPFDTVEIFQIACAMVNKWNLAEQIGQQVSTLEERIKEREDKLAEAHAKQLEIEKQFNQAQKMETVGRLTGGVAHDFNNLLTVVLGYVEMLICGTPKPAPGVLEKLMAIQLASNSAAKLTQQLLAYSRQEVVATQLINLNEIIEKNLRRMVEKIVGEKILLKINLEPNLPSMMGDTGRIEQVIMNIVVNARDAMELNGGKLVIETSQNNSKVVLFISDTGTGMAKEVRDKIFEPYFTTKGLGKGTGLGLSTVHGIIAQHHGDIEVTSEINRGTQFKITFPIQKGVVRSVETPKSDEVLTGKETIMLVEDEEPVRTLTKQILTQAGYSVIEAQNGVEAYNLFLAQKPNFSLLLTDVMMPEMGGRDLAKHLASHVPDTPVIFMSGYTGQEALPQTGAEGEMNFLQKPFLPNDLLRRVRAAVS